MFEFWEFFFLFDLDFDWFGGDFFFVFVVVMGEGWGNLLKGLNDLFLLLKCLFDFLVLLLLDGIEVGGKLKMFSGFL